MNLCQPVREKMKMASGDEVNCVNSGIVWDKSVGLRELISSFVMPNLMETSFLNIETVSVL